MEVDPAGKCIDRYQILEKLGEGGMAVVYKALDTRLKREVAIKLIRTENFPPSILDQMLKRFEREATALARLSHPNIVTVHDFGEYEHEPYLVMEYLPGGTLRQRIGEPIPFRLAAALLKPVVEALAYAHAKEIVHRDVKPINILFNETGMPKLSDFGIARLLGMEDATRLTGTGMGVGTPAYMAPEQWRGYASPSVDVYALGVVFYELLTGHVPYQADTPADLLVMIATETLPDPRLEIPELPEEVVAVLCRSLQPKPENRYQTMDEFAQALEGLWHIQPDLQRTALQTPTSEVDSTTRTSMLSPLENVITIDIPTPSPALPGQKADRPTGSARYASPPQATRRTWMIPAVIGMLLLAALAIVGFIWNAQQQAVGATETAFMQAQTAQTTEMAALAARQTDEFGTAKAQTIATQTAAVTETAMAWIAGSQTAEAETAQTGTASAQNAQVQAQLTETVAAQTQSAEETRIALTAVAPKLGSTQLAPQDGMMLAFIPGGTFYMGSIGHREDEQPVHTVSLSSFWMDTTEVTNRMYAKCEAAGECTQPRNIASNLRTSYYGNNQYADHPVIYVSWTQAAEYCAWAGRALPTEAQWEYAARGGLESKLYPWGDDSPVCTAGAVNGTRYYGCSRFDTEAVGTFGTNGFGLYDMAGNVWEWTADWYGNYPSGSMTDPIGPDSGDYRVMRGGSWADYDLFYYLRTAVRISSDPSNSSDRIGFRCARLP